VILEAAAQVVEDDDLVAGVEAVAGDVRADETGAAGDEGCRHPREYIRDGEQHRSEAKRGDEVRGEQMRGELNRGELKRGEQTRGALKKGGRSRSEMK